MIIYTKKSWAVLVMSQITNNQLYKLLISILIVTIILASQQNILYSTYAAEISNPKPIFSTTEHNLEDVNLTISIIVDPLRELETSIFSMKLNVSFNVMFISSIHFENIIEDDFRKDVIAIKPENIFFSIQQPKLSISLSFPMAYYYTFQLKPKSDSAGQVVSITYEFNTTVTYRNGSVMAYIVSLKNPISGKVLPTVNDMPDTLLNGILSALGITFLAPILIWLYNRHRKKEMRKKKFKQSLVSVFILIIILYSSHLPMFANANSFEYSNNGFLLGYSVYILEDTYDNDTYFIVNAYNEYLWLEEQINTTYIRVGHLYSSLLVPPSINYTVLNLQTYEEDVNFSAYWIIDSTLDFNEPVKIMNYTAYYNGTSSHYQFSMLREAILIGLNTNETQISAKYDSRSGLLYQLIIKNKIDKIVTAYRLIYVYGVSLSEKWDYYYSIFLIMIITPTIIVTLITWPKKSKINQKRRALHEHSN